MITKTEDKLITIFHDRGIEKDDNLGFMCILRKYNAQEEMLQWLESNLDAKYDEILEKITEIYDRE